MSVRGADRRDAADPTAISVRRDRRRRVRRAGGAPADLRRGDRAHRRSARIPGARLLPVQRPARRRDRKPSRIASCPSSCAMRCWRASASCRPCASWSSPIRSTTSTARCRRADLAALRGAGIDVVTPDLDSLRDSNPIYSSFWRLTMKWWSGDGSGEASLPNPLDAGPERVSFGAWARLLNFKADHRKVIIGDDGNGGITGIVTSANPHDASSLHSNVGIQVVGRGAGAAARERARARRAGRLETHLGSAGDAGAGAGAARKYRRACRCSPKARSAPRSCAISPARASATASTSRCSIYPSAT